jgi:hypothetical protein
MSDQANTGDDQVRGQLADLAGSLQDCAYRGRVQLDLPGALRGHRRRRRRRRAAAVMAVAVVLVTAAWWMLADDPGPSRPQFVRTPRTVAWPRRHQAMSVSVSETVSRVRHGKMPSLRFQMRLPQTPRRPGDES